MDLDSDILIVHPLTKARLLVSSMVVVIVSYTFYTLFALNYFARVALPFATR